MTNFAQNLAIAIGINQYQDGIAKLKTAKSDAEELAKLLRDEYQYQVELITDDTERKPKLKELENLLTKWLPEQLQPPAENNRLLFYFAGHGMPLESDDGPRGFLLPQDAHPNNSKTFLPMQVLHDALVALPCHHLLVILDCCFAGTFRWSTTRKAIPILETIHREHYDRFIRYPAWQVITSAAHNQEALDFLSDKRGIGAKSQHQAIQHSPFAEALFEALQNGDPDEKGRRYKKADLTKDGVITAPELYLYLRDNVETRSEERQTPGLYPLKKHDRGEYIFHDPNFDPQTLSKADPINETNNPYRGLKPFEEEHAHFFFGRQELIENLYARIAAPDHLLTVVLGVSGSGKSSLVKAGLIPYLRGLSKPPINSLHQWHILNPIRPGESPFAALARTIWALADMPTIVQLDSLGFLSEKLNKETKELNTQVANASSNNRKTSRTTQRLKQEVEKFAQITTTWNQDTHAAKQRLIVEHFETLYALCQTQGEPESQQQQQLKQVFLACLNRLTERLQSASNSLVEIVKAWSQKHPGVNLLLVIDQFEELITLTRKAQPNPQSNTPEEWQQFLQLLETTLAATLPQLRIIVTLRSDFEPRFLNSEALKSYWTRARFPVRAMRSDELRQAIERPALEMALYFEPANLVDRLIDEVGQMPGALPLLSFTLSEFYIKLAEKWRDKESSDRALTIDVSFDKEGGVAGSLTRRANEEYKKLGDELGEAAQQTMRRVMLRMLTLEGGETARRRVPESELVYPTQEESDRVKQVVDQLVEARLLVKGQLETGEPYVEAAHDFLVRGWGMLQNWINEEKSKETLELQQRLTAQANDWDRNNRPHGLLMPDGDRLNQLEKMLKLPNNWFNQREKKFVERSIEYRKFLIRRTQELRVKEEIAKRVASIMQMLSIQPLDSLVLAIQAAGQNLDEFPKEIFSSIKTSLLSALDSAREKNVLVGHYDNLVSVAISPDGNYIASGSADKTLCLWDLQGNLLNQILHKHEGAITSVAFSPDGKCLAIGSENGILQLYDKQGNYIEQSPDRKKISFRVKFYLLMDKFILYFFIFLFGWIPISLLSGLPQKLLLAVWILFVFVRWLFSSLPKVAINTVAFSPNGQYIISGHKDGTIWLWGRQGAIVQQLFRGHKGAVTSVDFSPDGHYLVSGGRDKKVRLWNKRGKPVGKPFLGHEADVKSVAFSPDSQLIVSGSRDKTVRLWNRGGRLIGQPFRGHEDEITSVAFSPDGQTIVSGSYDKTIRLWNRQGKLLAKPFRGHEDKITSVAFSPDGQTIISGSYDKTIRLWDRQGKSSEQDIQALRHGLTSVAFSQDGKILISGSYDGELQLWNLQGEPISKPFVGHKATITSVAVNPSNQFIASSSLDNTIRLWDKQGNLVSQMGTLYQDANLFTKLTLLLGTLLNSAAWIFKQTLGLLIGIPVLSFLLSFFYNSLLNGATLGLVIYSIYTLALLLSLLWESLNDRHEKAFNSIAFTPNGRLIISGGEDWTIRLWNLRGIQVGMPFKGHEGPITAVAVSSDGQLIISGSSDKTLRLWDMKVDFESRGRATSGKLSGVNSGKLIGVLEGHTETVTSVAISADGKTVVSGSADRTVRLWNQQGNQALHGHEDVVTSVAISPDGQLIVSGSADGTVRLWNQQGNTIGQPLYGHDQCITSVSVSNDGQTVASSSFDGTVRVWDNQGNLVSQHEVISIGNDENLEAFLQVACDRLHYHPVFKNPQTEIERQACETCRKYVWSKEDTSV